MPPSDPVRLDEKIAIARKEGFHPLAIETAIGSYETSAAHKLLLLGLAAVAAALVAFLFPVHRFFKTRTADLGTMTIGAPLIEDEQALLLKFNKPWLKVLSQMDRLYFREGKLTEAIAVAEKNLERVPEKNWEDWKKVHYRYWELLADAGRAPALKTAANAYRQIVPEDPFANYYAAQALLAVVAPVGSFNREMRRAYRQEARTLVRQIDRACNALKARQKTADTKKVEVFLGNLYKKLRLQQAKLFALIWRLGGYKEDDHPDVVYRDKALDILDRAELAHLKEALALKISVYENILDRWHWFEGQQVIRGIRQSRRSLAEEFKLLKKELEDAETL